MIHQAKQKGRIMKRRMIAVLLSGILLCSAAGCGKEAVTDKSTAAELDPEVLERTRNEIPSLENRRDDLYRVSSGNVRIYEE